MTTYRVCLVVYKYLPDSAGVARSASRLVRYLLDAGMEVHIIVPNITNSSQAMKAQDLLYCANYPVQDEENCFIYRPEIPNMARQMSMLMELIRLIDYRCRFDIFHGYWLPLAFPCLMIAAMGNRPVIGSIRGNDAAAEAILPENFSYIFSVLQSASWITSVNSPLLSGINGIVDVSKKSSVILNGIDSSAFPQWKGFDETSGVVGTVGELRFKKAIPILVEAYSMLPTNIRRKLVLGGYYSDPNEKTVVDSLIGTLNIQEETINTGFLDRKALLEQASELNVFVICSYHDGLPNTLLEAAACGVPIIASKVGGMIDVLKHGENALLFDPGNVEQLAQQLNAVLTNRNLAEKLSKGALDLSSRLNCEQEKDSWLAVYEKFLLNRDNLKASIEDDVEIYA